MGAALEYWADQRVRFLVIGACNTAFGYGAFVVLYALLDGHVHYLAIAVLAHACAVIVAFAAHKMLVFRSCGHWLPEFMRYNISLLMGLGAGLVGLWVLVSMLGVHPILAQAVVTVLVVILNYLLHSRFSFAQGKVTQ